MMPNDSSLGSPADELLCELAAVDELELVEFEVQLAKTLAAVNDKMNKDAFSKNALLCIV